MEQISNKIVTIRKPHKCFGCYRKFEKGEGMRSQTCKYEGSIYKVYSCQTCDTLMTEFEGFFLDTEERMFPEGCITQIYYDYKVNNPEDLLIKLREQRYELGRTKENRENIKG